MVKPQPAVPNVHGVRLWGFHNRMATYVESIDYFRVFVRVPFTEYLESAFRLHACEKWTKCGWRTVWHDGTSAGLCKAQIPWRVAAKSAAKLHIAVRALARGHVDYGVLGLLAETEMVREEYLDAEYDAHLLYAATLPTAEQRQGARPTNPCQETPLWDAYCDSPLVTRPVRLREAAASYFESDAP
jgi:hypothetical protein